MLYLEDFYVGDVLTDSIHPVKQMKFVCKQAEKDIPVFVPCIIRDEKMRQFKWWWGGDWKTIPENGVYDTGIAKDFKFTELLTTFYAFNFSGHAFGGFESEVPNRQKNGAYGIIPKGGYYWKEFGTYISDRLIINFKNETKPMTLEEAIIICKEKACDDITCAIEYKQLAEWLEELQQYRKNTRKEE